MGSHGEGESSKATTRLTPRPGLPSRIFRFALGGGLSDWQLERMRHHDGRSVPECREKWPDRRIGRRSVRLERSIHLGNLGYIWHSTSPSCEKPPTLQLCDERIESDVWCLTAVAIILWWTR